MSCNQPRTVIPSRGFLVALVAL